MSDKAVDTFTIGQGKLIPLDHTGPASYTTGGETIGTTNAFTGIAVLGLSVIDFIDCSGLSVSGNFWVQAQVTGTGSRKSWKLLWFTATASVPSLTQVAAAVNLTAETVRLVYIGR
jgi:hypothetical protein